MEGILPSFQDSAFAYQVEGRFFNWKDIINKHRVALIVVYPRDKKERRVFSAPTWAPDKDRIDLKEFVKRINLLNQSITIEDQSFTVVGILRAPTVDKDFRFRGDQETMQQIFANTTKLMIDTRAGNNLLYLPLDKLVSQTGTTDAGTDTTSSTVSENAPSSTGYSERERARDDRSRGGR